MQLKMKSVANKNKTIQHRDDLEDDDNDNEELILKQDESINYWTYAGHHDLEEAGSPAKDEKEEKLIAKPK